MNKKLNLVFIAIICLFLLFLLFNKQIGTAERELNTKLEMLDLEFNNEIIIAVIDSGLDIYNFNTLQVVNEVNIISDSAPIDYLGHGTKVANVIADFLQNLVSPSKLKNFKIMPIKVFDDVGQTSDKYIIDGISKAVNNGAKVINLSFKTNNISKEFINVLQYAINNNVVVVMCAIEEYGTTDELASLSELPIIWVDSFEQRNNIKRKRFLTLGTTPYNEYKGASFAVPQVSSTVAVMLGLKPDLQPYKIKEILSKTAVDRSKGIGLLNITEAIKTIK